MNADPRAALDEWPLSRTQIAAIATTVGLNALDGFDVLAISFAAPGIAAEWGIDRAALGVVLSMELLGMAMGSIVLGGLADRIGRRPTMLGCLVVMATGMYLATRSAGIAELSLWRVVTGLGIGGMLAAITAAAAEFANARRRSLCVSLTAIGYPVGAVIGGSIAAELLKTHDWRAVFLFGAAATVAFIPLVLAFVPESVPWLCQKQPAKALERVNATLGRMGRATVGALPELEGTRARQSIADILKPGLIHITLLVTLAYFLHVATFYFILKWVPKLVVDMGFAPAAAAGVLVWANVGGATGGAVLGLLTQRYGVKSLTLAVMLGSAAMITVFGRGQADLTELALICAVAGFFTNAGMVGMYAIFAQAFPTHVRATGTGFALGLGRGGAALSPILAGYLFGAGFGLQAVALVMALGSLLAAVALAFLRLRAAAH
jgi:benzoate transport